MAVKKCPKCSSLVGIAKKICQCGHVFLEKKSPGFRETPIVITPERLRYSRAVTSESRPVRIKKQKCHGDFVYNSFSKSKEPAILNDIKTSKRIPNEKLSEATENGKDTEIQLKQTNTQENEAEELDEKKGMCEDDIACTTELSVIKDRKEGEQPNVETRLADDVERLYPKRDRTKITRYEDVSVKKKNWKYLSGNNGSTAESYTFHSVPKDKLIGGNCEKFGSMAKGSVAKGKGDLDKESYRTSSTDVTSSVKRDSFVDSEMLLKNLDVDIDVVTVTNTIENRRLMSISTTSDESFSECESVYTEDGDKLIHVRIPEKIKQYIQKGSKSNKSETPENDDIPLIQLRKNSVSLGTVFKRSVGRPRKHPIVVNKIKRPVGRPRKVSTDLDTTPEKNMNGNQRKKRPHTEIPYAVYSDQYYRNSDFEDDDDGDDEADPDYKSPKRVAMEGSTSSRTDRPGRRCFLSPPQLMASAKMDRIRNELLENVETERLKKKLIKKTAFEIPADKKELYAHILKEINRRIASQAFSYNKTPAVM